MIARNAPSLSRSTVISAMWLLLGLFLGAFFTATEPLRPEFALGSSLAIIGFALPAYIGVIKAAGQKAGLILLGLLGLYALAVETSALQTGFPYGTFVYNDLLGTKLFGVTPWTVAFAYPPILLFAYWLSRQFIKMSYIKVVLLTGVLAMACDLVLDPAAVKLGFWYWPEGGFFYNVPLVNFAGWILSSSIGAVLVHYFLRNKSLPALLPVSGLLILFFWTSVNLWQLQWIPVLIGLGIIALALHFIQRGIRG
jgi:bisanhydrobacterioruberin hydratase